MERKILQINVNHSRATQDLAMQRSLEDAYEIVCMSEPYSVPARDTCFSDTNGLVAICGNPGLCSRISLLDRGKGFVAVETDTEAIYSCYISPNICLDEFESLLQDLGNSITKQEGRHVIVTGDFNSKHNAWGSKKEDARGRTLLDWIAQHKLIILNEGTIPTCSRGSGDSVIDISLCTVNMIMRVKDWKVCEDMETLSDHRYILIKIAKTNKTSFAMNKRKEGYPKWNLKKIDEDLFVAALIVETWKKEIMHPRKWRPNMYGRSLGMRLISLCQELRVTVRIKRVHIGGHIFGGHRKYRKLGGLAFGSAENLKRKDQQLMRNIY